MLCFFTIESFFVMILEFCSTDKMELVSLALFCPLKTQVSGFLG